MKREVLVIGMVLGVILSGCAKQMETAKKYRWDVHDYNRPVPAVVTPGAADNMAPSDAIVLFDGNDLSEWVSAGNGSPAKWKVENGYMEAVRGAGDIKTKQAFGDCQLHIEWATPEKVVGRDQGRGNSGVFLMSKYEVQVLDSYNNKTYADGQAGAIYGQKPPLVNVCRPPGAWQSYDIIFHRPTFKDGKVEKKATETIFQNGVLIQDNWTIEGTTFYRVRSYYEPHPDKMPLILQDHGNPIRFRNIWMRELKDVQ